MTGKAFPVVFENRVRFAETDQQGVVFYGTFFTFQDEAVNAFFRAIGYPYSRLRDHGWTTHVVHAELDFEAGARFEDEIENRLRIDRIGESSLVATYRADRKADGARLASGRVIHVAVDLETDTPITVPEYFRDAVTEFQGTPPETTGED